MEEENVENDIDSIENEVEENEISDEEYFKEYELFYQKVITVIKELKTDYQDTNTLITRIKSNFGENECMRNGKIKEKNNEDLARNFKKKLEKTFAFDESLEQMEMEEMVGEILFILICKYLE